MRLSSFLLLLWASSISGLPSGEDKTIPQQMIEPQKLDLGETKDVQGKIDRLLTFLRRPDVLPIVAFIVGVGTIPLSRFAAELVTGRLSSIPSDEARQKDGDTIITDEEEEEEVPDECASLKDPQTSAPDFQQAGGGFPPGATHAPDIWDDLTPEQRAEYWAFEEGLRQGGSVGDDQQREIHMQGLRDGFEDAVQIRQEDITDGDAVRMHREGWYRRDQQQSTGIKEGLSSGSQQQPKPKTAREKKLYHEGYGAGFAITRRHRAGRTRKIIAGYARGLCVRRCVLAEMERVGYIYTYISISRSSINPSHSFLDALLSQLDGTDQSIHPFSSPERPILPPFFLATCTSTVFNDLIHRE